MDVVEGGDASGNDATRIGRCLIQDLPPGLPAGTPVGVTFRYQEDGRLTVNARVRGLNRQATCAMERASGLTAESLREWNQRLRNGQGPLRLR